MSGYVYILHSAKLPCLVKIGYSAEPYRHVRRLRSECKLPDFRIVYLTPYLGTQARELEGRVHEALGRRRVRRKSTRGDRIVLQREWFRCSVRRAERLAEKEVRLFER